MAAVRMRPLHIPLEGFIFLNLVKAELIAAVMPNKTEEETGGSYDNLDKLQLPTQENACVTR